MRDYAEIMDCPIRKVSPLLFILLAPLAPLSGADWELVWSDEFSGDGALDPAKWTYDLGGGGWGNNEKQVYTNELANARRENGHLVIEVQQSTGTRVPTYSSARILTRERMSMLYGRVEFRAKLPSETGTWSAVWLLSTDALVSDTYWPNNGEIDILEHVGYEEDPLFFEEQGVDFLNNVHSTLHTETRNHLGAGGIGKSTYLETASSEFHTYAMNWYPDRFEFFIDGDLYHTVDRDTDVGISDRNPPEDISPFWPFYQRFHLILNVAVGGSWGGHFNDQYYPDSPYGFDGVDHDGEWPQRMEVDYLRVYDFTGGREENETTVPATIEPIDVSAIDGVLFARSDSGNSEFHIHGIDADDAVRFTLHSAEPVAYELSADVAVPGEGITLRIEDADTGGLLLEPTLETTGTLDDFDWQSLGTVSLKRGLNRIRIVFPEGEYYFGQLRLEAGADGEFESFPYIAPNVVDTGNWLGPVGTSEAPWLYVPRLGTRLMALAEDYGSPMEPHWVYIEDPAGLETAGQPVGGWFVSRSLGHWCWTPHASLPEGPVWILILPQN